MLAWLRDRFGTKTKVPVEVSQLRIELQVDTESARKELADFERDLKAYADRCERLHKKFASKKPRKSKRSRRRAR